MIDCGGGKNGSGSQANFAVATSQSVRNSPSTSSHGARRCRLAPNRPSQLPPNVARRPAPATKKAANASSWVRDQSPRSVHHRHDRAKPTQARLANTPVPPDRNESGSDSGCPASAPPSSAVCASATASDAEYVDIDALREFGGIGARLENRDSLQIVRIGLEFPFGHLAHGMRMVGLIADHGFEIVQRLRLRRIWLERFCGLVRILRREHGRIQKRLGNGARNLRLLADQTAAQPHDAAALVPILVVKI